MQVSVMNWAAYIIARKELNCFEPSTDPWVAAKLIEGDQIKHFTLKDACAHARFISENFPNYADQVGGIQKYRNHEESEKIVDGSVGPHKEGKQSQDNAHRYDTSVAPGKNDTHDDRDDNGSGKDSVTGGAAPGDGIESEWQGNQQKRH